MHAPGGIRTRQIADAYLNLLLLDLMHK